MCIFTLRYSLQERKRATTIERAIEKRSHKQRSKKEKKNKAKRLRATTFAIPKLKER